MKYYVEDYRPSEIYEILQRMDHAQEWMEAILEELYSSDSKRNLEEALEELAHALKVCVPGEQIKYERKNETLKDIQFLLKATL